MNLARCLVMVSVNVAVSNLLSMRYLRREKRSIRSGHSGI